MEKLADIGVFGIGVMGKSIALNFADNGGYTVALYNRTKKKVDDLVESDEAKKLDFIPTEDIKEFVHSIATPRRILLMVPAGRMVDECLNSLVPWLDDNDIIIDGGNSFFGDTIRREKELRKKTINYFGVGISGGEYGARNGASIMPGGDEKSYHLIKDYLEAVAAKYEDQPCCEYLGENGAGHYVKMIHNGIEYADMQLISEAYYLMKNFLKMSYVEMAKVFTEWNSRALGGYLIEITADILKKVDTDTSQPILEIILDRAGQKGTGKWTSQAALDLGVAAPTIAEAVFARCSSADIAERRLAAAVYPDVYPEYKGDKSAMIEAVYDTLLASKIVVYAQGFKILDVASKKYNWDLDCVAISSIWRNGCIIRAKLLNDIAQAYSANAVLVNMLLAPEFYEVILKAEDNWKKVVGEAVQSGMSIPALSSALSYFQTLRCDRLWTDLIQAQRDYFGAHTFERVDKPEGEFFHVNW